MTENLVPVIKIEGGSSTQKFVFCRIQFLDGSGLKLFRTGGGFHSNIVTSLIKEVEATSGKNVRCYYLLDGGTITIEDKTVSIYGTTSLFETCESSYEERNETRRAVGKLLSNCYPDKKIEVALYYSKEPETYL